MFLLVPYHVDVPTERHPWSNWFLVGFTVLTFLLFRHEVFDSSIHQAMVLDGWGISGLIGHMFLHAGWFHLIGNVCFLWVFGNALCARVGNLVYPFVYLGFGLLAATSYNLIDGGTAVGASGVAMGLVGLYLVLYPLNEIRCFWLLYALYILRGGFFEVSSFWVILYWSGLDVLGMVMGWSGIGYSAHLGGLGAGIALACFLVVTGLSKTLGSDRTLVDLVKERLGNAEAHNFTLQRIRERKQVAKKKAQVLTPSIHAKTTDFIRMVCGCGRHLKAPQKLLGNLRPCPGCHDLLQIWPST